MKLLNLEGDKNAVHQILTQELLVGQLLVGGLGAFGSFRRHMLLDMQCAACAACLIGVASPTHGVQVM